MPKHEPPAAGPTAAEGVGAVLNGDDSKPSKTNGLVQLLTGSDVELAKATKRTLEKAGARLIYSDGAFWSYGGTHWARVDDDQLRRDLHKFDGARWSDGARSGRVKLSRGHIDSILNELASMCAEPGFFDGAPRGVNAVNGLVRMDGEGTPTLEPHRPAHRARFVTLAAWEPGRDWRSAPLLGALLNGCFRGDADRQERINLIGEICGAAVLGNVTTLPQPKAFVFHGPAANNGKSQLIEAVRSLLPADATSSLPPSRFGDPNMVSRLVGVTLNSASELGTAYAVASDAFKAIVTGDSTPMRRLYKDPTEFRPRALHLFATNALPSFQGGFDRGVRRRLMVLQFNRTIPVDEMIPNLASRIAKEEGDALLAFAVEGASRLLRNGAFTEPPSCAQALEEWVHYDPVLAWVEARTQYACGVRTPVKDLHRSFVSWAICEGFGQQATLPRVNNFVQRLLASDGRLGRGKSDAVRYVVGLRLRCSDD